MTKRRHFLWLPIVLLFLTACSSKAEPNSTYSSERASALSTALINDLPTYLRDRDNIEELIASGAVVTTDTATYGANALEEFLAAYEKEQDASFTLISAKSAFVVSRLFFEDGAGYYLRYQHDPKDEENFAVTTRQVKSIRVTRNEDTNRIDLALSGTKEQVALIQLRNIAKLQTSSNP